MLIIGLTSVPERKETGCVSACGVVPLSLYHASIFTVHDLLRCALGVIRGNMNALQHEARYRLGTTVTSKRMRIPWRNARVP